MWQSWIEIEYYPVEYFERITKFDALYSAKLPLGAGLIRTTWMHQIFMHLHSAYEPHP